MRRKLMLGLSAFATLIGFVPALQAGPGVTVYVAPRYYNPYYYPPYFFRLYGPLPGDGIPISPPAPTVFQAGPSPIPAPGTIITGAGTGLPQRVGFGWNAGQPVLVPQVNAAPAAAAAPKDNSVAAATGGLDVDKALQLLSSAREHDRMEAAIALGRNKVEKATDPLQNLLATDFNPRVREAAARALGLIGSPKSLKALQTAAQADDDSNVRHSAQFAAETIHANAK